MRASVERTEEPRTAGMASAATAPRRPTSRVARVYPLLVAHLPRAAIGAQLGLRGSQLTEAIRGNYRLGYLAPPPAEVRRAQHRANTSAAKGGIALCIRPYLELDLTARQTQTALRHEQGIALSLRQISSAYGREVHRHGLRRPTAELTVEAQRDKRRPEEQLVQIVRHRQAAHAVVKQHGLPKPKTLQEWQAVEEQFEVWDEVAGTLRRILPYGMTIPPEPRYRRLLLAFWEHAQQYQREGIRSLAFDPYFYLEPDETLPHAIRVLRPQLRAIQQRLVLSDAEVLKLLQGE